MWDVLKVCRVSGKLLSDVTLLYEDANACVRVNGEVGERFKINEGVRQGCIMSSWLFNLFMDGVVREMKARVGKGGVDLCMDIAK